MRKVTTVVLALMLTAGISILALMANMGDKAFATGVYTDGHVDISLVTNPDGSAELIPGAGAEKTFKIKNEGNNAAWVWFSYAVPKALDNSALSVTVNYDNAWTSMMPPDTQTDEEGKEYTVYTLLYNNALNDDNESTSEIKLAVTMASDIDIDENGNWIRVNSGNVTPLNWNSNEAITVDVAVFAVQTSGSEDVSAAYDKFHQSLISTGNTSE